MFFNYELTQIKTNYFCGGDGNAGAGTFFFQLQINDNLREEKFQKRFAKSAFPRKSTYGEKVFWGERVERATRITAGFNPRKRTKPTRL